jgi:hypothetical protein
MDKGLGHIAGHAKMLILVLGDVVIVVIFGHVRQSLEFSLVLNRRSD